MSSLQALEPFISREVDRGIPVDWVHTGLCRRPSCGETRLRANQAAPEWRAINGEAWNYFLNYASDS